MTWLHRLRDNFARKGLLLTVLLFSALSTWAAGPQCSSVFREDSQSLDSGFLYLGDSIRPHMFEILERAEQSIDLEMSLAPNKELFALLKRKSDQGVKIRVILDNRSANKSPKHRATWEAVLKDLQDVGAEYAVSDKEALMNARGFPGSVLHRKLILVDQKYFYVGSSNFTVHDMNIEMGYFGPTKNSSSFKEVFDKDFRAAQESWRTENYKGFFNADLTLAENGLELVGPGTKFPDLRALLLQQIQSAKSRILISAYEATDNAVLQALLEKKRQHPAMDIRVVLCVGKLPVRMLGKNIDIPKNARYLDVLTKAGIDVRTYGNDTQYNHSRFGLFDGLVYGGSADFVTRSFQGSVDLGFISNDQNLAEVSKKSFESLWDLSRQAERVTIKDRLVEGFFLMVEQINYLFLQVKILTASSKSSRRF